jgi:hypothetical protein
MLLVSAILSESLAGRFQAILMGKLKQNNIRKFTRGILNKQLHIYSAET